MKTKKLKINGNIIADKIKSEFWDCEKDNKNTQQNLILLDNVQFIYELTLAELELKSLGADFEISNGYREFKVLNKSSKIRDLIKKGAHILKLLMENLQTIFK
jgi:hypothetical protein